MNYSPDLISTALKMLVSLGIVLGGLFVTFYFMKRLLNKKMAGSEDKLIRVLANTYIGVKKNISLVEVPGALLVIGITNDNISLLSKIEDEEILNGLRFSNGERGQVSFSDHLHKLSEKLKIHKRAK
ncbi:MAG: flagellar biosynthetic protein FliO [Deltaproteobacteria bacterium]|jgi:flagellar protein FliO/FliZ|nr:flagellar biosynthetic protein FliO [Deltaproteobacteria bacterium]MBW2143174.1 flagellar biosynthetic protein FliO [Deltaproteobacteria bacterium]